LLDEGRNAPKDPTAAADEMLRCVNVDSGECLAELISRTSIWSTETIKAVQTKLKTAGYYSGPINGRSGPDLAPALKQWRLLGPQA
jgi:peptidoglycan hydrolase-like protein with peptidoglycan-binding domain